MYPSSIEKYDINWDSPEKYRKNINKNSEFGKKLSKIYKKCDEKDNNYSDKLLNNEIINQKSLENLLDVNFFNRWELK